VVARECEAGKLVACEGLRAAYSGQASRLSKDPAKASVFGTKANELLERQCQTGDRDACRTLVHHLLYFSPADVPRGRRLADQECASGDYSECWKLGEFLTQAGPNRDPTAANGYFARAVAIAMTSCDAGEAGACYLLSEAYRFGKGVARDVKKSGDYMVKAVDLTPVK
jgi:TPR repeat protein